MKNQEIAKFFSISLYAMGVESTYILDFLVLLFCGEVFVRCILLYQKKIDQHCFVPQQSLISFLTSFSFVYF